MVLGNVEPAGFEPAISVVKSRQWIKKSSRVIFIVVMATVLDGKTLATAIRAKVKGRVASLSAKPGLAVLLVGDDPASHLYVNLKEKACAEVGIRFERKEYAADVSEDNLVKDIRALNQRTDIDGILIQLPLPSQNADHVVAAIDPKKDVDGFHPKNLAALAAGLPCLAPPVHLGVMKLIESTGQNITGKTAVVVSSVVFGSPLVSLLGERNVSAHIISLNAKNLKEELQTADIVVTAIGRPAFITGDMLKPQAIVIDVGTSKRNDKVVGDVDRSTVDSVAAFVSPVPGGSGPLTVAYLLLNVLKARQHR